MPTLASFPTGATPWTGPETAPDWPNRATSRFIKSANLTWHVQTMGEGPVLLLAHGTGAATHSWRDLMPLLAQHFTVVAPDLQGHGFTTTPPSYRMTLNDMAAGLSALMQTLNLSPEIAVGHSAGAAILARMALDGGINPAILIALNGAMLKLPGFTGNFFATTAKMLALIPAIPWLFTRRAQKPEAVDRLIAGTGSTIDPAGVDFYGRLFRNQIHVANVLGMMANWDLEQLERDLPNLKCRLVLIAAANDRAVPLKLQQNTAALVPGAKLIVQSSYGHLSHEEAPQETAALIVQSAIAAGVVLEREEGQGALPPGPPLRTSP